MSVAAASVAETVTYPLDLTKTRQEVKFSCNCLLQNKCTWTVSASWNKHWDCKKTLHALIRFQMIVLNVFFNRLMMFWRVTRLTVFLINTSFVLFLSRLIIIRKYLKSVCTWHKLVHSTSKLLNLFVFQNFYFICLNSFFMFFFSFRLQLQGEVANNRCLFVNILIILAVLIKFLNLSTLFEDTFYSLKIFNIVIVNILHLST